MPWPDDCTPHPSTHPSACEVWPLQALGLHSTPEGARSEVCSLQVPDQSTSRRALLSRDGPMSDPCHAAPFCAHSLLTGPVGKGSREPSAQILPGGQQPQHPAPLPVVWKPHQAPQPQGRASLAPTMGRPLQDGGRRHSGPRRHLGSRRPQAQLLRVGCMLGTCQVQNLSHRLWQLVGPAGRPAGLSTSPHTNKDVCPPKTKK
uniref:Adrenomedullin 2 n=1 Tax=Spermophilus dauricus TaxID=99837 RepID=A0A8C9PEN7_SPEDA